MRKMTLILAAVFTLLLVLPLAAHTPKNALGAVAVSPDGKTVVAGGDNRVLYVIDAASLEVKKRIWLKVGLYEAAFNKDGSVLVVEDTSETLHFIKTADWQVFNKVTKAGYMSPAPAVDLVAGLSSGYQTSTIKFISMSTGTWKDQVQFPGKVVAIGLNAQGNRLVVLANGPKGKEEKKPTPKGLRGFEADVFRQKNDGRVSIVAEYAVPSGKKLSEQTIFYCAGYPLAIAAEKKTLFIDYVNLNIIIVGDKVDIFQGKSSYNYASGVSADRKSVLLGGLRDGTLVNVDDMTMKTFEIDTLPGWPEYYKGFAFGADGTGYGVTTSYRLVKINKNGMVEKVVPIY